MALLHCNLPLHLQSVATLPTFASNPKSLYVSLSRPSYQRSYPLFTTRGINKIIVPFPSRHFPGSCCAKPPHGKFVNEEYLVKKWSAMKSKTW
ncbi:hypothetical protein RIF29_01952 [Crotalaria pallida]|uniref:Uncharacterized protein n=1 Tax=Crotalaria pallida TaxID=3830 RepID=A0AAN9IXW3_CROPI